MGWSRRAQSEVLTDFSACAGNPFAFKFPPTKRQSRGDLTNLWRPRGTSGCSRGLNWFIPSPWIDRIRLQVFRSSTCGARNKSPENGVPRTLTVYDIRRTHRTADTRTVQRPVIRSDHELWMGHLVVRLLIAESPDCGATQAQARVAVCRARGAGGFLLLRKK